MLIYVVQYEHPRLLPSKGFSLDGLLDGSKWMSPELEARGACIHVSAAGPLRESKARL